MTNKIFRSGLQLSIAVVSLCIAVILLSIFGYINRQQEKRLGDEMKLIEAGFLLNGITYLEELEKGEFRITLVDEAGEVLFDSRGDKEKMENHLNREEIKIAFTKGIGKSQRMSATLLEKNIYLAKRQKDGTVLRVSVTSISFGGLLLSLLTEVAAVLLLGLLLAIYLSSKLAKNIVKPLNQINLDEPTKNDIYEELSPFLRRIEKQRAEIKKQITQIRQKNDEFLQVIACMQEGLVLLDKEKKVLTMNAAAKQYFEVGEEAIGKVFLDIDRNLELYEIMETAVEKGKAKYITEKSGRTYQFNISKIESQAEFIGLAIVMFDMSERSLAEKSRREFSANVSHELKTPLQSIMGSAELLESGLVKKEDEAEFIRKIRKESERLLTLIQDIIKLSQLDEGSGFEKEAIRVSDLIYEVVSLLENQAKQEEVRFILEEVDEKAEVLGMRQMLMDMIYNLCENAVKYNKNGGEVRISLVQEVGEVRIFVRDTGIGIPLEHRERVFERFYCVDKSRTKKSGGTGLGLAIVKHAVAYMGGKVELMSEVNEGTEVRLFLPHRI